MSQSNLLPFVCPVCLGVLAQSGEALRCPVDELTFVCEAGIWRFLPPQRAAALAQFRQEYETVRRQEGRGSDDPAFYRAATTGYSRLQELLTVGATDRETDAFTNFVRETIAPWNTANLMNPSCRNMYRHSAARK